jgi:hypothetical protein
MTGASVTARALLRRMNRKLSPQKKIVGQTRGKYRAASSGEFYVRDYNAGGLAHYLNRAELETMARELGALEDGETVSRSPER